MKPLTNQQIGTFIKKKLRNEPYFAAQCSSQLLANEHLTELARTPFFLGALCTIFNSRLSLSNSLSHIYYDLFYVILPIYPEYSEKHNIFFEDSLYILSEIAYYAFEIDNYSLSENELLDIIEHSLNQSYKKPNLTPIELLDIFTHRQIFLKQNDVYSFSHFSFCEFFTAKYIHENNLIQKTIDFNISNPRYRNVFLFLIELLKQKTDILLMAIARHYQSSQNPYFKKILLDCKQRAIYVRRNTWETIETMI